MLDVEVLGWRGYTWSAVVRPIGWTSSLRGLWGRLMVEECTLRNDILVVSVAFARHLLEDFYCGPPVQQS